MGSWCLRDRMEWKEHEKKRKNPKNIKSAFISEKRRCFKKAVIPGTTKKTKVWEDAGIHMCVCTNISPHTS